MNLDKILNIVPLKKIKEGNSFPVNCDECPLIKRVYNSKTETYELTKCPFGKTYKTPEINPKTRDCESAIREYNQ